MEKANDVLTPDDIVLIAIVTAKVHANVKRLRKKHSSPEEFGEKGVIQLAHRDRLLVFSLLFNINDIDPAKYYKPEDLGEIVLKQIRSYMDEDRSGIHFFPWDTPPGRVSAKDMNRALEELERIIDLKTVKKKDIRNIAKEYQIKFSGKPSLYQFPNDLTNLKRIYSDRKLAEPIIKALVELGLIDDLTFFIQGIIHFLRNNYQEEKSEVANKVFDIVTNSNPLSTSDTQELDFQLFRKIFSSIPKSDLNAFVRKAVIQSIKNPTACIPILMLFLFRTDDSNPNKQ